MRTAHVAPLLERSLCVLGQVASRAWAANPTMALVAQLEPEVAEPKTKSDDSLPPVLITPCDPWPRPYFLEEGLRKVHPYHFTYNTYCKERWRGRKLLDIFSTEFRDRPLAYYKGAIEEGRVTVNGQTTTADTVILNGQVVSHTLHRHEPPVSSQPIGIVHEDDDMIVINKPAGVPVHPAGRYNYNSVVEIMRSERGYGWNPMPCNRLDRLTSGLMFVGKHGEAATKMGIQLQSRTIKKEYIARVAGEFPAEDIICDQPILQISPKLGLNRVRANGKEALTVFKRIAYYPSASRHDSTAEDARTNLKKDKNAKLAWKSLNGYSIVRCLPLTGRTHQLRVHLQFLGHPITNDPIYCNRGVFGPELGAGDDTGDKDEDIITRLSRMGKEEVAEAQAYHEELMEDYNKKKAEKMSGEFCKICDTPLYTDPGPHELGIYLHARKYECAEGNWSYETEIPAWALPPKGYEDVSTPSLETGSTTLAEEIAKLKLHKLENESKDGQGQEADQKEFRRSLWAHPGGL